MKYRILSLDGGGTWALIQVKALLDLYGPNAMGYDVLKDFDLVVANSGGSIVAAGLAANMPLSALLADFNDPGWLNRIFVDLPIYKKVPQLLGLPWPKYDAAAKLQGLQEALNQYENIGDAPLEQIPARFPKRPSGDPPQFLITSFDYDISREIVFRSNLKSPVMSAAKPIRPTLAQAIHASSNAPIKFFDKPATFSGRQFWDGAMAGLNNPILIGLREALACGVNIADIQIRSIGTGTVILPFSRTNSNPLVQAPVRPRYSTDLNEESTCIIDDPPDESTFVAYTFLNGLIAGPPWPVPSNLVRLSPVVQPILDSNGTWVLPRFDLQPGQPITVDKFTELRNLAIDAKDPQSLNLIGSFCDAWLANIVPNQPIRMNRDNLQCEIGQAFYKDGKSVWL